MTASRAYLDYNASAPLLPEAREAMLSALDRAANPSSVHTEGRTARGLIEDARRDVASLVGGQAENVVFTSGATEAAATLLSPHWTLGRGKVRMSRLFVCEADHPCLLSGGRFAPEHVSRIGVDADGVVRIGDLHAALKNHEAGEGMPLVAMHAANNETGVIQPFGEIAAITKAAGGVFVLDAVQAVGRIALDLSESCADFLILSAHKMGGPTGVGAFVAASGLMMPEPLIRGGGQEKGHRAGTENLAGIAGFGAAARSAAGGLARVAGIRALRDRAEDAIHRLAPDAVFFGASADRLANTSFFAIPGLKAETAQMALDLAGISVSAGSACSSGKVGPSHVLKAMGFGGDEGAIRLSIGAATTLDEIDRFSAALATVVSRRSSRGRAA